MSKCPSCGKTVYAMEQELVLGKPWHKTCVVCSKCKKRIPQGQYNDNKGLIFCKKCHEELFLDDESKQMVADLENTYARKQTKMHAVATIPNSGKSLNIPAISEPKTQSSSSSNQVVSPRKAMPSSLQAGIVASAGQPGAKSGAKSPRGAPPPVSPRGAPPPVSPRKK